MNCVDWWCDYSIEEAIENYIKFCGIGDEDFEEEPPVEVTEEEMNKYKYSPEGLTEDSITFKEELENRIKNNDVPSFFASTEY